MFYYYKLFIAFLPSVWMSRTLIVPFHTVIVSSHTLVTNYIMSKPTISSTSATPPLSTIYHNISTSLYLTIFIPLYITMIISLYLTSYSFMSICLFLLFYCCHLWTRLSTFFPLFSSLSLFTITTYFIIP